MPIFLNDVIYQEQPDIVCLQETWHLENACGLIGSLNDKYYFVEQSGVDSRSSIISGRPHGGVAIPYKKTLGNNVGKINTKCKRICALRIKSSVELNAIFVVSIYMPCDTLNVSQCADEYRDVMQALETLLNDHDDAHVVIVGDWNTDPLQKNAQTEYFYAFTAHIDLELSWNHSVSKRDYTYVNHGLQHRSYILCMKTRTRSLASEGRDMSIAVVVEQHDDHFVMSRKVFQYITACYLYESPLNPSDHNYVFLCLQ